MAWPPSYSSAFLGLGLTSIKWGTDGLFPGNPNSIGGSYIVKSMRAMDIFETIYIENGTGLRGTRIGLIQGREWELTVVDDTSLSPPTYNTRVTLMIDPLSGFSFSGTSSGGSAGVVTGPMSGRIIDNSYNAARKQEGERVIRVVWDTLIEGALGDGTAGIPPIGPPP